MSRVPAAGDLGSDPLRGQVGRASFWLVLLVGIHRATRDLPRAPLGLAGDRCGYGHAPVAVAGRDALDIPENGREAQASRLVRSLQERRLGMTAASPTARRVASRWLRAGGYRLHARVSLLPLADSAPTVVMVHGLLVSSRYMLPTAVRLATYCRVHIPDLPGYGKSGKPREVLDVPQLADALGAYVEAAGLDRIVLLGNSFGCQIAVDYAARYPQRVQGIVLAGPTVEPSQRTLAKVVPYWLVNLRGEPFSLWLVCFRDFLDMGPRRLLGTFQHMLADRIEDKLPHVQAPTLVVRGEHDTTVPTHWAEEVVRLLPRGRLGEVPGAAHTVNFNAPARFERLVRPFLLHSAASDAAGPAGGTEFAPPLRGAS